MRFNNDHFLICSSENINDRLSLNKSYRINHTLYLHHGHSFLLRRIYSKDGHEVGVLLLNSTPGVSEKLDDTKLFLPCDLAEKKLENFFEDLIYKQTGRFIAILNSRLQRLYVDPMATLSTVYSSKSNICSSSVHLINAVANKHKFLKELYEETLLKQCWLPFGMTPFDGIHRLQANHFLDLNSYTSARHWPLVNQIKNYRHQYSRGNKDTVRHISSSIQNSISALSGEEVIVALTGGHDSRVVLSGCRSLAQSKENLSIAQVIQARQSTDEMLARKIAKKLQLSSRFLPVENATTKDQESWDQRVSFSVHGNIRSIHKTFERLPHDSILLPGTGAELGKAVYWKASDFGRKTISTAELVKRLGFDEDSHQGIMRKATLWHESLRGFTVQQTLDLLHLEQRIGNWAGPQVYGQSCYIHHMFCFSRRDIITGIIFGLSPEFKFQRKLSKNLIEICWPDLLEIPFNSSSMAGSVFSRSTLKQIKNYLGMRGHEALAAL